MPAHRPTLAALYASRYGWYLACLLACAPAAWAQLGAGRVMAVNGIAKAVNAQGQERPLEKGAEVFAGEKIVTGEGGLVQMRLHDGGYLSVRPSTEMVIDRFSYDDKNPADSNFLVSLVRGGFRSITGMIGRTNPSAYQIRTTTATLGIRGTDHEPMVIPEGPPGPGAGLTPPGMYDKVNDGETFIQNKFGVLSLKRGDVGFAPVKPDVAPQVLQKVPDFYKIELKTDARDAKDASSTDKTAPARTVNKEALLRPTLSVRKDAVLTDTTKVDTTTTTPTVRTLDSTTLQISPVVSDSLLQTTTVKDPVTTTTSTTTLIAPTTTVVSPTTTLISPTTTLTPITTTVSPTITTTTTVTPVTTTISPTTLIVPKTTTTIISTTPLLK